MSLDFQSQERHCDCVSAYLLDGVSVYGDLSSYRCVTIYLQIARLICYEGGSESSVIGVLTLLIDMIDCCIIL